MRVVIADPPAFTPWYDHELASALARAGAEVELATSHFRFAELPPAVGLPPRRALLPALLAPLPPLARPGCRSKAPSTSGSPHALGRVRSRRAPPAVARAAPGRRHTSASAARRCSPPTTSCRGAPPSSASSGCACCAGSTASSSTPSAAARRCAELGDRAGRDLPPRLPERRRPRRRRPDAARARRDPALQGAPRRDRGRAAAPRCPPARRRRPGDAARRAPRRAPHRVAARLPERRRSSTARSREATVALFPYRAELDQSGALLQALGAGVPAVAYDVGGLAEPIARYGAGRVVPPATSRR